MLRSNSFSASLRAGDAHQRQPPPAKGSRDRRRARPVARRQPVSSSMRLRGTAGPRQEGPAANVSRPPARRPTR